MPSTGATRDVAHTGGARRVSAVSRIYAGVRERIVDLSLPPGTPLSKQALAAEFGVSQTPVREALLRLEDEGLIEVFPQSRTVVSAIDVQHAREAHFLRLSVEVEVARRLGHAIDRDQVAALRAIIERQSMDLRLGDLAAFADGDNRFHQRLYELAGVGGLWGLIDTRRAHIDRLRRLHLPTRGKATTIVRDHSSIVDAIANHDPAAAERAVREHLRGTLAASDELRRKFPEYFH